MSLESWLARHRATGRQYILLVVLLAALIIDGLDLQLLSLVAPLLIAEWGVDKSALGPAMSAAMIGMSLGAVAGGWLGDRLGRRVVLVGAIVLFGSTTGAVALTSSLWSLAVLRILGGIGFGAAAPNAIALASEWLGGTLRLRAISLMSIGAPLGGLLGAIVLIGFLGELGWRGSFLLCGAASLLTVVGILVAVPESPSFLLRKGLSQKLDEILTRWFKIDWSGISEANGDHAVSESPAEGQVISSVTSRFVVGCGFGFFCISFVAYGCAAWLPVMATMQGLPLALGLKAVIAFNTCAVLSAVLSGVIVPKVGSRRLIGIASLATGIAIVLLALKIGPLGGAASAGSYGLWVAAAMAGGGTGTVLSTLYMVVTSGYPAAVRSGGVGLGMMLGRSGGIASTFSGGYLLGASSSASWPFFAALGVGVLGSLASLALIDRHLSARS